jgi:hypothetical protein
VGFSQKLLKQMWANEPENYLNKVTT